MSTVTIKTTAPHTGHLSVLDSNNNDICQHLPIQHLSIDMCPHRPISVDLTLEPAMLEVKATPHFDEDSVKILNNLGWVDRDMLPTHVHEFISFLETLEDTMSAFKSHASGIDHRLEQGHSALRSIEDMLKQLKA